MSVVFFYFLYKWNVDYIPPVPYSSEEDRPYLKLAAGKSVLRLAARWDSHVSPELFRNTVLMAKVFSVTLTIILVFTFHM
jgi:hypothetical protein